MSNQLQSEFWNGDAGKRWVEHAARLDAMLLPIAQQILTAANIQADEDVLDIGCGAGALSLMAAKMGRSVLGVDISEPLIDLAWSRSEMIDSVNFKRADASALDLDKKRDIFLSRFGVMFFSDPVSAFANIRRQIKPNGRMVFACWQSPALNHWAKAPLEAATPFLKSAPTPPDPKAPGPFALADTEYLSDVLMDAGWNNVQLVDWTGNIRLPGDNPEESAAFMMEMGPLSKILKEQELDFEPIEQALVNKLSASADKDGHVDMQGAAWIVKATAS